MEYNFVPKKSTNIYNYQELDDVLFYQVAYFLNPKTKKYNVRKFTINSMNEFADIKDYYLDKERYEIFMKLKKPNEYRMFEVYDFKNIDPPSLSDILILRSQILSNNDEFDGYATF